MKHETPLIDATLLRRYKRFLADVRLADGRELTVHCPNPGGMRTCAEPGRPVLISDSNNPKRKLRFTLEMIQMGRTWVGVNSVRPNRTVTAMVRAGSILELAGYPGLRTEVAYGDQGRSRIDLLLQDAEGARRDCYVEIKNTTYRTVDDETGTVHGAFPDAPTARGRKHLEDLTTVVASGARAVIFFHVGRADVDRFRPADEIDPAYGTALRGAVEAGVEAIAYRFRFTRRGVTLAGRLPIDMENP